MGREHDGVKTLTISAGSTYVFWMVVYLGAQGQDVRTVARLTVIGKQGDQPSSSPPATGSITVERMGKDKPAAGREMLDRRPFISDVRVRPDYRDVIIKRQVARRLRAWKSKKAVRSEGAVTSHNAARRQRTARETKR